MAYIKKDGMKTPIVLLWFSFMLIHTDAWAACTGSSPTWNTTPDYASVNTCVGNASPGDKVLVSAGKATWTSTLTINKSLTLQGAGSSSTIIAQSGGITLVYVAPTSGVPIRITGFKFDIGSNVDGTPSAIIIKGKLDGSFGLNEISIDHNIFNKGTRAVFPQGWVEGVIYNNTFINCNIAVGILGDDNYSWSRPIAAGTSHSLFIEDNTFIINDDANREPNEAVYHQEGARTVVRYNTFDGTAYTKGASLFYDSHGNQNLYTGTNADFRGQPMVEVYNNTFAGSGVLTYRPGAYFRGGSIIMHDNTFTFPGYGSTTVAVLTDEEDWQTAFFSLLATLWSAQDQIMNSFFWNNTMNGNPGTVGIFTSRDVPFIQQDRDYFMHAPQATGGKAIYTGAIGTSIESFSSSGANAYYPYTPYTYPHPLRLKSLKPPQNLQLK
jgi:hypothetical protein